MEKIKFLQPGLVFLGLAFSIFSCSETMIEEEMNPDKPMEFEAKSTLDLETKTPQITEFFYDIKGWPDREITETIGTKLFKEDGINGLRIPIFGTQKRPAHPAPEQVEESYYENMLHSIELAKSMVGNQPFTIFASKKLDALNSFPSWVKNENGIIPERYAQLLTDYLVFLQTKNVEVDYLGIDNEFIYNEGNITPEKYVQTIDQLREKLNLLDIKMPKLVGYEDYGPNKRNWLLTLKENGWLSDKYFDVYGTHYYPQWQPLNKLQADLALLEGQPFWSTEPHWSDKKDVDDLDEAEEAVMAFWQQIDEGMSAFMWWAYGRGSGVNTLRGNMMQAISAPMLGAYRVEVTDLDGKQITSRGELLSRAFVNEDEVHLYFYNGKSISYKKYGVRLENGHIDGMMVQHVFDGKSSVNGNKEKIEPLNDKEFSLDIPAKSLIHLSFKMR